MDKGSEKRGGSLPLEELGYAGSGWGGNGWELSKKEAKERGRRRGNLSWP